MPTFLFRKGGHEIMLPKEAIQEFKQIYFRKFGEELSDKEATEKANRGYELHKALFDSMNHEAQKVGNQNEPGNNNN